VRPNSGDAGARASAGEDSGRDRAASAAKSALARCPSRRVAARPNRSTPDVITPIRLMVQRTRRTPRALSDILAAYLGAIVRGGVAKDVARQVLWSIRLAGYFDIARGILTCWAGTVGLAGPSGVRELHGVAKGEQDARRRSVFDL
jgi:hypothetical protein